MKRYPLLNREDSELRLNLFFFVPGTRLELARLAALAPETSASTIPPPGLCGCKGSDILVTGKIFCEFFCRLFVFTYFCKVKKYSAILFVALLLCSCHSSKKVFPSDPIYDSGKRTEHQGGGSGKQNTGKIKDSKRKAVVEEAYRWLGVPYKYAGESRKGTDCSGFVMTVYKDVCGIKLPRNSAKQAEYCNKIKKNELQPGDLVFFATGKSKTKVSHVGIYVGEGNIIHASTSRGVTVNNIGENYYTKTYICSGRVLAAGKKEEKRKDDKQQKERKRKEQRKAKDSADDDDVISSFMD